MTRPSDADHGEWDSLAVGWALSALDPKDQDRFSEHLSGCARCIATVREALHTVADLAYALPEETPPRRLRRRIMQAAAAEPRVDPHDGLATGPFDVADRGADSHAADGPRPDRDAAGHAAAGVPAGREAAGRPADGARPARDADHPTPDGGPTGRTASGQAGGPGEGRDVDPAAVVPIRSRRRIGPAAIAAMLALIVALVAWNVKLHSDQDQLRNAVAERDELVTRLTEAGPARIAIIRGPAGTGDRSATVVVKQGRIGLVTETLPPQPSDRTYWLWSLRDRRDPNPVPLANFAVPESRLSACNIEPPPGVDPDRAFAISTEPASVRPTTPTDVVAYGSTTDG
jgi:hypothetical protein